MSAPEKIFSVIKDVVLPVDVRTRYDVYFTDRRVAIVCMGRADRAELDSQEQLSFMPSAFGVPAPAESYHGKGQVKASIDDETKGMGLDALLKLSKKSCFYTLDEIEKVELVWGSKPKFLILSRDCESKFEPDQEQLAELLKIIPAIEILKSKLWVAGKYTALFDQNTLESTCKSCGACNDVDAAYCQSCGIKLDQKQANQPPS